MNEYEMKGYYYFLLRLALNSSQNHQFQTRVLAVHVNITTSIIVSYFRLRFPFPVEIVNAS